MNQILNEFNKYNNVLIRKFINNYQFYQSFRFNLKRKRKEPVRKPIWQPIAPSKLFRIRNKPVLTEQEQKQRQHMEKTFDLNMRSIEQYFRNEFFLPTLSSGGLTAEQVRNEELNQMELLEDNDRENERIARLREERMKKMNELIDQKMIVQYLKQTEEQKQKGRQIDETVRQEIKRSETYITRQTLDAAIDEALTHPISYDFAIDTFGNIHTEQPIHPYALTPNAVPEMSSNIEEFKQMKEKPKKLEQKVIY